MSLRLVSDLEFYISEGWKNFSRSKGTTLISIFIIAISIAIITIFSTFFVNIDSYLNRMRKNPYVSIYLKDNASPRDIKLLKDKVSLLDGVKEVVFIPKEKGLKIFYKTFPNFKGSENELGANPIPDSFVVKIDSSKVDTLISLLNRYKDVVDDYYIPYSLYNRVQKITSGFSLLAFILTIVLMISSVITIYNVIKITIVSRKEDIAIMQLVGANMRYIRMPFVFEGILQGLTGGIAGILLGNLSVLYLFSHYSHIPAFSMFLRDFHILSPSFQFKILLFSILFGIAGSLIASLQIEYK